MIVTDLDSLLKDASGEQMAGAAAFLAAAVLNPPSDGRVSIDGEKAYAIVQSYSTRPGRERPRFEAHRRYIDVQFVLEGFELCGWAPFRCLRAEAPYDEAGDVIFGRVDPEDSVLMPFPAGRALVLYPWDAHAPCLAAADPAPVRKIVVKIAV